MSSDTRRLTRREKRLFISTGCLVAMVFLGGYWWRWINTDPALNIPMPKMPNPNAFDYYIKAGQAYISASPSVEPVTSVDLVGSPQELKRRYPTAAKEAWLATNAPALQLLRTGFAHRYQHPPILWLLLWAWLQSVFAHRYQHPPIRSFTTSPFYSRFRNLARMLATQSHARAERGNWSGASNSALDILHLGHDIPHGGGVIASLVGTAIQSIGLKELSAAIPHLDAPSARTAARRLEKLYERHVTFAATMQEDKWSTQAQLSELMRDSMWRQSFVRSLDSIPGKLHAWLTPKRTIINNYTRIMDVVLANARQPYTAPRRPIPPADDPMTAEVWPNFERTRCVIARGEAGNALPLVTLALRAFQLEHGAYPRSLSELVPTYLKAIPADPFGGGEVLRYRREGSTYALWSIGPDGMGNKGHAIDSMVSGASESRHHLVQPESKGDMVAGINR